MPPTSARWRGAWARTPGAGIDPSRTRTASATRRKDRFSMRALRSERLRVWGNQRQRRVGREHAPRVVAAQRDDVHLVLRTVFLVDVFGEGFAARAAGRPLCHRRTRRVEAAKRKDVDLAEQVSRRKRRPLTPELIVAA